MNVSFNHIFGPYSLTKGSFQFDSVIEIFRVTGAKMHLYFCFHCQVHLVYTLRIRPITSLYWIGPHLQLDRRLRCKLYTQCCRSVFLYRVLFLSHYFWIICMYAFFVSKRICSPFFYCYTCLFKLSQKTITGKLICCMSLHEVNIQFSFLFWDVSIFFFFFN